MITRETITAIATKIFQSLNPDKIILFGSYAWGKPEIDSDLDLFIVMESKDRPIKRAVSVRHVLRDLYVPMDILVRTPDEIQHRIDIGDPFIKKILRDGQVIYARNSPRVG